jgi:NAD(P)-dependent dehydrogenase (short-subunit alcohol dehydrogenase family)
MALRAVLVTGGASGLGRATALRLAATGRYGVVIADLKNEGTLPNNVVFAPTDVSSSLFASKMSKQLLSP